MEACMLLARLAVRAAVPLAVGALGLAHPAVQAQGGQGAGRTGTAAGITWAVPDSWADSAGSSMRVATYAVEGAEGAAAGECAVFYFGPGQGGGVDDNVQRWVRQFKERPDPRREEQTVAGVKVTRVDIEGTYLNPGGGLMQSRGEKPGYRLLGAIVEAPGGNVFFKLTAPGATAAAAEAAFERLLGSIARR
jgi:hypothetical protein